MIFYGGFGSRFILSIDGFLKKRGGEFRQLFYSAASFALYSAARLKRRAKDAVAI
jgi:hypothetical protein